MFIYRHNNADWPYILFFSLLKRVTRNLISRSLVKARVRTFYSRTNLQDDISWDYLRKRQHQLFLESG